MNTVKSPAGFPVFFLFFPQVWLIGKDKWQPNNTVITYNKQNMSWVSALPTRIRLSSKLGRIYSNLIEFRILNSEFEFRIRIRMWFCPNLFEFDRQIFEIEFFRIIIWSNLTKKCTKKLILTIQKWLSVVENNFTMLLKQIY